MTEAAASPTPLCGVHVAVVSGDREVLASLTHILNHCGAFVTAHDSERSVLRLMEIVWVNALVLDVRDTDDASVTLIRKIRALPPEDGGQVPIIALCGGAVDRESRLRAERVDAILRRPVRAAELTRTIVTATCGGP